MKYLFTVAILAVLAAPAYARQAQSPKCELQELAIEAALGEPDAQYDLGVEFFRGESVPRDYAKAATMWRMASNAGSVGAANNLGFLKYYGRSGVERDYAEGVRLWRLAAERGFAESQVHLGEAYSDGRHLKQDLIEAYAWATAGKHYARQLSKMISKPGIDDEVTKMAEKVLTDVRQRLSKAQLADAEKRAAEYISKYAPR